MRKLGNFLLGALIGGVVGAVSVLLLTPVSGVNLRDRINSYVRDVEEQVHQAAATRREELQVELDNLRQS